MKSAQALSERISSDLSFMMAKLQGLADSSYLQQADLSSDKTKKQEEQLHKQLLTQDNAILVEADKGRITQVIDNLLSNALKFTNEGDISVSVEIKDDQAVVSLKDNGQGIDPIILPKLFTKFATSSSGGIGLGLYISKSIVEAHGGRMWAENNSDGKGATFAFSLPCLIN